MKVTTAAEPRQMTTAAEPRQITPTAEPWKLTEVRPCIPLLEQVWGYRHPADTRLVNVHVQRLRAKVEKDPENPQVVLTVRGVGYKAGPP
ncbi:hypothetical protein A5662_26470 [Mycobacteriaceae bacterium 1482268.1]|nr:hypothetical protein A5662_26470 [Mycobacteriaceae bacterium 1482268.1]